MATLTELNALIGAPGDPLTFKITGALLVAAQAIVLNASASDTQKAWARECLRDPTQFRAFAINAAIAKNNTATTAQIMNADDVAVQTAINAVLPILTG